MRNYHMTVVMAVDKHCAASGKPLLSLAVLLAAVTALINMAPLRIRPNLWIEKRSLINLSRSLSYLMPYFRGSLHRKKPERNCF